MKSTKKKTEVTAKEWDRIADEFSARQAGHTRSFSEAMNNITRYMNQFKIIKPKKQ